MISNEQFLQYNVMLHKICNKFKNNTYSMEFDDLFQVGSLGIIRAYETYKDGEGVTFDNYVYRCIKWAIMNELRRYKRIKEKYNSTSLDLCIDVEEEETLHNIIADESVNVSCTALDNVIIEEYIKEFKRVLSSDMCNLMIDKHINDISVKELAQRYNKSDGSIRASLRNARDILIRKSPLIRIKYDEFLQEKQKRIDRYANPSNVVQDDEYFNEIYEELNRLKAQAREQMQKLNN